jgi:hypothetical protein
VGDKAFEGDTKAKLVELGRAAAGHMWFVAPKSGWLPRRRVRIFRPNSVPVVVA